IRVHRWWCRAPAPALTSPRWASSPISSSSCTTCRAEPAKIVRAVVFASLIEWTSGDPAAADDDMENDPIAHFQKTAQNVSGKVLAAAAGDPCELGLWRPLDTRTTPPTELAVSLSPPNASVRIGRAGMLAGQNVLVWRFHNLPVGRAWSRRRIAAA